MKKKTILSLLVLVSIFLITGCEKENNQTNNENNQTKNETTPDHKIYKYMKISSDSASNLLYSANALFDEPFYVSNGDKQYKPCLIAEFDTKTGKATKVKFYAFFLDNEDNEWVNKAIEKFESSSSENKKYYTNISKGRVNDEVSYLSADVDINCYQYTQFIDSYIIKNQDIEKYKDEVFFSRLYNYSSNPPHEEGENYFEESLESSRIEWSDKEIKAY